MLTMIFYIMIIEVRNIVVLFLEKKKNKRFVRSNFTQISFCSLLYSRYF